MASVNQSQSTYPLVSVIIPVYNVALYLTKALDSIINQTYSNLEIIIIDDGSTDGSEKICDEYAQRDERIKVLHTTNNGLAAARNLGLIHSRGSIISFMDGDDWIEQNAIETLLKAMKKHKADVVVAKTTNEYVGQTIKPDNTCGDLRIFRGKEIISAFVSRSFGETVWDKLYRRECFDGIQFPAGYNHEDIATIWKIMKNLNENDGTVVVLDESLFHYRIRKRSISHTKSFGNVRDAWNAYHGRFEALSEYQDQLLPSCMTVISSMWMNYNGFSKEEKERARDLVLEMQQFSIQHLRNVMKGNYSKKIKLICMITQSRSSFIMLLCYWGGKIRNVIGRFRHKMYD